MVHHNLIYCLPIDCILIKVHHNSRYCLLTNCILIKVHHTSRYCFLTDCILIKVHHNSRYYLPDDCVLLHITKILLTSSNCTGFLSKTNVHTHNCTYLVSVKRFISDAFPRTRRLRHHLSTWRVVQSNCFARP